MGIITIPRAASSSIENSIDGSLIPEEQFKNLPVRFAFMRNPYNRIESTYRMYLINNPWGYVLESFPAFVKDICMRANRTDDPHITPQIEFCKYAEDVICWDFALLSKVLGVHIRHDGRSMELNCVWDDEAHDFYSQEFRHDIILWNTHLKKTS